MVNDLKEFWNKLRHDFVTDNQSNRDVNYFEKELQEFFLGEVERLTKELHLVGIEHINICRKNAKKEMQEWDMLSVLGSANKLGRLEGRFDFAKELAGVEQK